MRSFVLVFLQARTVAKIVKGSGVRTTTTEKLDPSIGKEVQKMKEKMDAAAQRWTK